MRFEGAKKSDPSHPFLHAFRHEIHRLRARRIALSELPVLAQAAYHVYDFKICWREGLTLFDLTSFAQRFSALRELAQCLDNAEACAVFETFINRSQQRAEEYLYNPLPEPMAPGHLEFKANHPDFDDARPFFAPESSFVDDAEVYISEHVPTEFLTPEDWQSAIHKIIEQIPDYWQRPHVSDDLSVEDFALCEQLNARLLFKEIYLFDWTVHQSSRVAIKQNGKVLTSWAAGKKTARNDFDPMSVSVSGLSTTKGDFWRVMYRDVDDLVDPETYRVLFSRPSGTLRKDTLFMREDAPIWRLDPVRKRLTKPSVWDKVRNWTQ